MLQLMYWLHSNYFSFLFSYNSRGYSVTPIDWRYVQGNVLSLRIFLVDRKTATFTTYFLSSNRRENWSITTIRGRITDWRRFHSRPTAWINIIAKSFNRVLRIVRDNWHLTKWWNNCKSRWKLNGWTKRKWGRKIS